MGGAFKHLRDAGAGQGGCGGAVGGVGLLEGFEFEEEGVEGAEVVDWVGGVEVEDCGEGEAEEEIVGRASGEFSRVEVRHLVEVCLGEEEGVEPVDSAFVTAEKISLWVSWEAGYGVQLRSRLS